MIHRLRRLPGLLAPLAVVCVLAGCGSSSSTVGSSGSGSGSPGARTAPAGAGGGAQFSAKVETCLKRHGVAVAERASGAPTGARPTGAASTGSAPGGNPANKGHGATPPGGQGAASRSRAGTKPNKKLTAALKACGASSPAHSASGGGAPPAA
jgi:hypothetical protein